MAVLTSTKSSKPSDKSNVKPAKRKKSNAMTWTQVKRHIQEFPPSALLDLIKQMYDANDMNKAFLTARFNEEGTLGSKELTGLKKRIYRLMCPNITWSDSYPQLREARKIITEDKKTKDDLGTLDLMLTYVEAGNKFTCTYGDIDSRFYDSLCSMLDTFSKRFLTDVDRFMPFFQERLKQLGNQASELGWGYGDWVSETLEKLNVWEYKLPEKQTQIQEDF